MFELAPRLLNVRVALLGGAEAGSFAVEGATTGADVTVEPSLPFVEAHPAAVLRVRTTLSVAVYLFD